ncbi:MAG TPA: lysine--tRNA ligase [Firmicutes bacterium]|nr:lysine--tRNA ligase [Bacillota bacterium]
MKAIIEQRLAKLRELQQRGIEPFPYRFQQTHHSADIKADFENLSTSETPVRAAGRLMSKRPHGKSCFGHIRDLKGDIQVYFKFDDLGAEKFELLDLVDIGDTVGVEGIVFKTRTGEITIRVKDYQVLTKAIRPMPEKWHGLKDRETRYRQRYVDLAFNMDVREIFVKRATIIRTIRRFLDERGFIEVETPVLQPIYGGGNAEPFTTYHKALDMNLYLRIADELYLKRLLVGGLEKVYEMSKDFRNEGMDRTHSPEFTQLELYQAYADYFDMMELFEQMMERICMEVNGRTEVTYQGVTVDMRAPWKRLSILDAVKTFAEIDLEKASDEDLRKVCSEISDDNWEAASRGAMIDEIVSHYVEPKLVEPTFLLDFPAETSPLAKVSRKDPRFAERFEPFAFCIELGNAFSELNDPMRQLENFRMQRDDTKEIDYDFVRALQYGMPPAGGLGVGIDRVVMILTDSHSIRDVILFPQMRPEPDLCEEFDGL